MNIKTRIAAGIAIFGLGGLAGLALNAGNQGASQPVADKPLVRTKVIRRTVHVTKHAKPKRPSATAGSSSVGAEPSYSSESAPVTTSSSGASAAPSESTPAPVTTATSGGGAAGGGGGGSESESEYEGEGGGDD